MDNSADKERYLKTRKALKDGNIVLVKDLAEQSKQELIKAGYVRADPVFRWIEKEWLEKGLTEGVIVYKKNENESYTGYNPKVEEIEVEEIKGYRGRNPIVEKRKKIDASRFFNFLERYKKFKKQQFAISEEMSELMDEEEKYR